jgi:hypothetical protein
MFVLLMTNFAFPMPKVYRQTNAPTTITAGSLPIVPNVPVTEWIDMLVYLNNLQDSSTVVCSWWDYGYWLTMLGNVTSLADNATINGTQIENVGFIFLANETQSLKMLEQYDAQYVLVFTTLTISDVGGQYTATWAGFGDEGKWMWMARISGKARNRFVNSGMLDNRSAWVDEETFGSYNNETNTWEWNEVGKNSTIYKLMSWGKQRWGYLNGVDPGEPVAEPLYFKEAYFAWPGMAQYSDYRGLIPVVCLFEIDWEKYYSTV